MRLLTADIVNFRSVKAVTVSFDPACRVLVGINESGKSNILNALSYLSDDYNPDRNEDVRDSLPEESEVEEGYVCFWFRLDKAEADELFDAVVPLVLAATTGDLKVAFVGGELVGLKGLCNEWTEVCYFVDLLKETKSFRYRTSSGAEVKLKGKWAKPTKACPANYTLGLGEEQVTLATFSLVRLEDLPPVPEGYLAEATVADFRSVIGVAAKSVAKRHVPRALFWKYDEAHLLPSSVGADAFAARPDSCVPLKNMFLLGGIDDIHGELSRISQLSSNKKQNFLDRIAAKTTKHFRTVWKEYKDIEFQLRFEGDKIIPGIKEQNSFDFAKRSDGFKRFVTFLLMVSVTVKIDTLTDTLLLVDEPDVGLHPSGARYLRDELIRISGKNYVVYSTHSIFMIDAGNVGRHYVVKKKHEVTTVESAKESNIKDEEVLFNALGFSMLEVLKQKNIVFEGWRDKKLFITALPKASSEVRKLLKEVGLCHAKGVSHIKSVTPLMELAGRQCLILSDSDEAAKSQQKQYRLAKGFGDWWVYQEVAPTLEAITGEDFIKNSRLVVHVNDAIANFSLSKFSSSDLPASAGKLKAIELWLTVQGLTALQVTDTIDAVKTAAFDKLEAKDIESCYSDFMEGVAAAI